MFCTSCGKIIPDDSSFCGYCGEHLNRNIEFNRDTEINADKEDSKALFEQDNDISVKMNESLTDDSKKSEFSEESNVEQEKSNTTEKEFKDLENKDKKNKKYWSVIDKVNENKGKNAQKKNKHDTAEIKIFPNNPIDLYKVNKSIQQSVVPAGVKVINKYNKPFNTSTFFWAQVVLLLPIVNIILLFIWAFRKNSNVNRKSYARSILIWLLLFIIMLIVGIIILLAFGYPININYWINELKQAINSMPNI